jgi:hypothetical protein
LTGQFKPVRLTVLIGATAIIVCGFAVFYTHRSAHGTTAEESAARRNAADGRELNLTAQKYFEQQGPAEQLQNPTRAADVQAFKEAFKKGYTIGFKKTHAQQ